MDQGTTRRFLVDDTSYTLEEMLRENAHDDDICDALLAMKPGDVLDDTQAQTVACVAGPRDVMSVPPVTALGIVCAHTGDSFGQRTWSNVASPLRVHVSQSAGYWSVSVHCGTQMVAHALCDTLEQCDASCSAQWATLCEAVAAARQAQTAAPATDDDAAMHRSPTLAMVRRPA